jgi:hypothetical protein
MVFNEATMPPEPSPWSAPFNKTRAVTTSEYLNL